MSKEEELERVLGRLKASMALIDLLYMQQADPKGPASEDDVLSLLEGTIEELTNCLGQIGIFTPLLLRAVQRDIWGIKEGEGTKLFKTKKRSGPKRSGSYKAIFLKSMITEFVEIIHNEQGGSVEEAVITALEKLQSYKEETTNIFNSELTAEKIMEWRKNRRDSQAEENLKHIVQREISKEYTDRKMLASVLIKQTKPDFFFEEVVINWIKKLN